MRRLLSPFVLVLSALLGVAYAYTAWRLTTSRIGAALLAVPFALVWLVPVLYWVYERESRSRADELLHAASYLAMGWLNFVVLLALVRDALLWLSAAAAPTWHANLQAAGPSIVFWGAAAALLIGALAALRGPHVRRVDIPLADLPTE